MLTKKLAAAAVILLAAGTVANAQFNFKNLKDAAQKVAGNNKPSSAASAANQVNRLFGLNQQGTEIVRPSMYCNKYPWEKAKDLFGKVDGYGAQMPR